MRQKRSESAQEWRIELYKSDHHHHHHHHSRGREIMGGGGGLAKQLTTLYPGQVIVNFNNFYDSGGRIVNRWGGGGGS